ncbi:hypothetical protein AB0D86_48405 [Streptomyces sp. NPDC048324]|uniref:hypothetical protein n=1 Tax=Streptomyces sp. NPDC048324 TaxID=3157205 RepID=UPI00342E171D
MTDTLTPPTAVIGADSPLALLFDIALEIGTQGEDEQRDDAQTAALDHVWNAYPDTLGKALDEDDWSGQPALPGAGRPAAAPLQPRPGAERPHPHRALHLRKRLRRHRSGRRAGLRERLI